VQGDSAAVAGGTGTYASRSLVLAGGGAAHITCMLSPANAYGIERFAPVIEVLRRAATS